MILISRERLQDLRSDPMFADRSKCMWEGKPLPTYIEGMYLDAPLMVCDKVDCKVCRKRFVCYTIKFDGNPSLPLEW